MSGIFRVNVIESQNLCETIEDIKNHGYNAIATSLAGTKSIYDIKYDKAAIIIGNEANGVSKPVLAVSNVKAKIPMIGRTESLNAAVATGVILYEYVRRKI